MGSSQKVRAWNISLVYKNRKVYKYIYVIMAVEDAEEKK